MKNLCTCTGAKLVVTTGFILSLTGLAMAQKESTSQRGMTREMQNKQQQADKGQRPIVPAAQGGIAGPPPACSTATAGCCAAHAGTGCNNAACCASICAADAFCCATQWDGICAGATLSNPNCPECAPPPVNNNLCAGRTAIGIGATPYTTLGATTDGPAHASCLFFGSNQTFNDIWFNYTATSTDALVVQTCGSIGDSKIAVYDGCGCPVSDLNKIACNDDFCGLLSQVTVNVVAGNCYKIRVGNFSTAGSSNGTLTLSLGGPPAACPNPANDCCVANGTPGCSDETCCNTVCACDPFCCSVAWDAYCAGNGYVPGCGAVLLCGCEIPKNPACPNPAHSCFATGTPGCDNQDCCNAVCAADAFCCATFWDGLCVNGAIALCEAPPIKNNLCADRILIEYGNTSFSTIGATTDGPIDCLSPFGGGIGQDVWYNFVAQCDGEHFLSLCGGTGYDSFFGIYEGCECPPAGPPIDCNDDACGLVSQLKVADLTAGTCYKVRIGGFGAAAGSGILHLYAACSGGGVNPCPADLAPPGGDGQVNVDDLVILLGSWGPCN